MTSTATDALTYGLTVWVPAGPKIVAGNLSVGATTPAPGVSTGSPPPTETLTDSITFNPDVTILGTGPVLHIGPDGSAIEDSPGVTYTEANN